jgi:hypothetical protein
VVHGSTQSELLFRRPLDGWGHVTLGAPLCVREPHAAQPRSVDGDGRNSGRVDRYRVASTFDQVGVFAELDRSDAIVELTRDRTVNGHRPQRLFDLVSWLPNGEPLSVMAFVIARGRINEIYVISNRERVNHLLGL